MRQDQRSPAFEITEWAVRRLSDKGAIKPDGLWLVSGQGHDGGEPRPWSVVVKIFGSQRRICPQTICATGSASCWWRSRACWRSCPARCARRDSAKKQPDATWLWMEHIETDRHGAWALDDYSLRHISWGAGMACAAAGCRSRSPGWRGSTIAPGCAMSARAGLALPLHRAPRRHRRRYRHLWAERERFYRALEALPQSFGHFDSQRRNLLPQNSDAQDELVLVDWALCGLGPWGQSYRRLWSMAASSWSGRPTPLPELDSAAFASYLQRALRGGLVGGRRLWRLGYVAWLAISLGGSFPSAMATWCSASKRAWALGLFGLAEEALYSAVARAAAPIRWTVPTRPAS